MKTVLVKYLLNPKNVNPKPQLRFMVENEQDLKKLLDNHIIGNLQVDGIRKFIKASEKVIVNESGGYCNMKGTWELVEEKKVTNKDIDEMNRIMEEDEAEDMEKYS